ncbi:MAG: hypothetical protein J6M30_05895 [Bacteroidales bacterium]|nr:hypothetical protein [Bacteroidales bacterium]
MRCNNCGWNNPDTSAVCEKCKAPLTPQNNYNADLNSPNAENYRGGEFRNN